MPAGFGADPSTTYNREGAHNDQRKTRPPRISAVGFNPVGRPLAAGQGDENFSKVQIKVTPISGSV
jgi:hypothetical protein